MNLYARPLLRKPIPHRGPIAPAAAPGEGSSPEACCGWFESSHALSAGLVVREHAMAEPGGSAALGALLPLGSWLELELATRRGHPAEPLPAL